MLPRRFGVAEGLAITRIVLEIERRQIRQTWNKFDENDRLNNGTIIEIRGQTYFLLSKGQIILRANEKAALPR